MLFSKAAIFTAATTLAGLVSAQKVHVVNVGSKDGSLKFYPEQLEAAVGELVQFQFYPKNHSIARSNFANPCVPLDPATANGTSGFFSGFMPVQSTDKYMPTFTITVTDTSPIWYYCASYTHCEAGMSGVINPPNASTGKTLDKYKTAAATAKTVVPGPPSGGVTDPDGPDGPKSPIIPGNTTIPTGTPPHEPGSNTTSTTTSTPSSTNNTSGASSFFASAASVVLGAVAVAAFLI